MACDTLHSLFKFSSNEHEVSQINWNIAIFDTIFIDEVSQISVAMFHHIINCIDCVIRRPIVVMSVDFAQQRPTATVNARTTQVSNITSCRHCMSYVNKMNLTIQHHSNDNYLLDFLQHICYYRPTVDMLSAIMEGCVLSQHNDVNHSIYDQLRLHPVATALTITRRAATFINDTIITCAFTSEPLAVVIMNDQTMFPIHKLMRLMLLQNINKNIGFVNGQFVQVIGIKNATIIAQVPNGQLINIHPSSGIDVQPLRPFYAAVFLLV